MPLIRRTNGNNSQNLVKASWWNDFLDLLTGIMTDQPLTIKPNISLQAISGAPGAPTLTLASGGSLSVGVYKYAVTFTSADGGETLAGATTTITTTSGNQSVNITIPTGPTGTTGRNIYRTKANGSTLFRVCVFNDNTSTTYADSLADSAVGPAAPTHSTFGGSIFFKDQNGQFTSALSYDGTRIGNETVQALGDTPPAPTAAAPVAGGSLGVGVYKWAVTFAALDGGETLPSATVSQTTTSTNKTVNLTLPIGPAGTLARNIYRTQAGGSTLYFLAKISDNTTTAYVDSAADTALTTSRTAPAYPTFGGSVGVRDSAGNTTLRLTSDGNVLSYGGKIIFNPVSQQGEPAGSIFIGSVPGGTNPDLLLQNNGAGYIVLKTNAGVVSFRNSNNTEFGSLINSGNLFVVKNPVSNGPIGFRNGGGRLAEALGNGNFTIAGASYYGGGQNFDGFDVAECYRVDQEYEPGTIVCPVDAEYSYPPDPSNLEATPAVQRCTHDACILAMPISHVPGFCMGAVNIPSMEEGYDPDKPLMQPMALAGRVFVKTASDIPARTYVCSDGNGGVRAIAAGESTHAIGVTLAASNQSVVPIVVRPTFVTL